MSTELIFMLVLAGLFAASLIVSIVKNFKNSISLSEQSQSSQESNADDAQKTCAPEQGVVEEESLTESQETVEEQTAQEQVAATTAEIGDVLDDEEDDREIYGRRVTFMEKMLELDVRTQEYYDEINNEFNTYRKLHARISRRFVSYRFGKKLVAKISIRGRTMKMHFALDVKDFEEKIYFQKDLSDVKSYVETPFTVKVKSDRGLKRAISLIDALAIKEGMEKKTRTTYKDSMEEIRHLVMEMKKEEQQV